MVNQRPTVNAAMITFFVMLATIMQVLDTTIANVALPHMQGSLSATQDQITWILTSYIVASAIMTMPTGWLVGRYGRKRVFLASISGFTLSSLLCGIAISLEEMVIFRLLQGVFGAALVPLSQSTLLDIHPTEKHGSAMAVWGMGIMVGPILGPTLGGYLTEYYNWRWVFYINLPIGIISFIGISGFLPETEKEKRPFNKYGFLTLSLALAALQLMLDRSEQVDWFNSSEIILYLVIMAGAFWVFVISSVYSPDPFINFSILRDLNFLCGLILIFFVGVILLATMALLPPYMQNIMGYPVVDAGLLLAPRGIGTMIAMMIVGRLINRFDPRKMIFLGLLLTAVSLYDMSTFNTFVPAEKIICSGLIQGMGLGFIFVPLSTVAFATLKPHTRTEATSLYSLMRNLGSSIGVSIMSTTLIHNTRMNHSYFSESLTSSRLAALQKYSPLALHQSREYFLQSLNGEINRQASTIAFLNNFQIMMWMSVILIPLIFFLKNPYGKAHTPHISE